MSSLSQLCPIEPGSLRTDAEVMDHPDRFPAYASIATWMREVLMRPHPELGRDGPICPFVHLSARKGLLRYVTVRTTATTAAHCATRCIGLIDTFYAVFPDRSDHPLASLLVHFPDVPPDDAADFIDGGHRLLRLDFVRRGLMLGEFHVHSRTPGRYNPTFLVNRAPMPLFAVRVLSYRDLDFLSRNDFPEGERREYFRYFEYHLGETLDAASRAKLEMQWRALDGECRESGEMRTEGM